MNTSICSSCRDGDCDSCTNFYDVEDEPICICECQEDDFARLDEDEDDVWTWIDDEPEDQDEWN